MGFTHYWEQPNGLDETIFKAFSKDVKKIVEGATELCHAPNRPDEAPTVREDIIFFNGKGDDGYETFVMCPTAKSEFCKTGRRPYDRYVTACLILAKIHFCDDIIVTSDGTIDDWADGEALVREKTGWVIPANYLEED